MPFRSNIPTFIAALPDAIDRGAGETSVQIRDTERSLVPVDTGQLQSTIRIEGAAGSGERQVIAGDGRTDYAVHVEYGTATQAAQPFATPAAMQHATDLPRNVAKHLKELERQSRV